MGRFIGALALALITACSTAKKDTLSEAQAAPTPERTMVTLGNGEANSITPQGVTRDGATFTFATATVADDSWLVIHPFKDGRPNGDIYVGHTFLAAGTHQNIPITVEGGAQTGQMFLVMLHKDVDQDRVFDFVFIDENTVEDHAVFEGTKMIAHIFAAP
ncbi:MAG: hypothetical protein AAFX52_06270 [Pseudomonadota bacterium]